MIIKLELNSEQLDALHKALKSKENLAGVNADSACVKIGSAQSRTLDQDRHLNQNDLIVTPRYDVTLYVDEKYSTRKTPLSKLARVLQAVGLFPDEDNVPSE